LESVEDIEVLGVAASDGRVLITHDKATMPDAFGQFVQASESPKYGFAKERLWISSI
jgi:predicted nuclease of predicted toxin-antitoxin system